jgi:hypothetical protein
MVLEAVVAAACMFDSGVCSLNIHSYQSLVVVTGLLVQYNLALCWPLRPFRTTCFFFRRT